MHCKLISDQREREGGREAREDGKINAAMLHWVQFEDSLYSFYIFFYKPGVFTLPPLSTLTYLLFKQGQVG